MGLRLPFWDQDRESARVFSMSISWLGGLDIGRDREAAPSPAQIFKEQQLSGR
jgi:hypothetical protein